MGTVSIFQILLLLAIVALVVGVPVLGGVIARKKGRSVVLWVILCILLGFIPLIVLLFLSDLRGAAVDLASGTDGETGGDGV